MSPPESPLKGRAIFIAGARRSGTYWMQRIVSAHSQVGAVPSETHLFSHGIRPLMDRLEGIDVTDATVGRVYARRQSVIAAVRNLCDTVFEPYRAGPGGWVSERTPLHVYHLGLIAEVYPDAKLIQIVRDGRDVARSLVEQKWGPTTHEAAAMEWRDAVRAAREAGLGEEVYREVSYEQLAVGPEPVIESLFEWLGLPVDHAELDRARTAAATVANTAAASTGAERWRTELGPAEIGAVEAVAGAELGLMGYELSGSPPASGGLGRRARALAGAARLRRQR